MSQNTECSTHFSVCKHYWFRTYSVAVHDECTIMTKIIIRTIEHFLTSSSTKELHSFYHLLSRVSKYKYNT